MSLAKLWLTHKTALAHFQELSLRKVFCFWYTFLRRHLMSSREDLDTFHSTHQIRQTMIAGKAWFFYTGGVGSQTVVILPGTGAFSTLGAEVMFPVFAELEKQFRVFSFGYPWDVVTVRELVDGIHEVLAEQQVQQASLLGHSLGSLITLCFLSTYPQQVASVILANFALPSPSHMRSLKTELSLIVRLPAWLTSRVVKSQFRRVVQEYPDDFWRAYLTGKEADRSFQHMTTHYRCMLDFVQHWHISHESFTSWHGRALLLESDHEPDVTPQERANTEALFVNASIHVFQNAGHLEAVCKVLE
jgi:pimeloyl-ACP methyl ester carboxylesterase